MRRAATGEYEVSTTSGERVRAFVPHPLPPRPPLDLSGERQRLFERALLACGRLDGISAVLPEADLFLYTYVRREAVLSSQIEGTQSSLSDLLLFEVGGAEGVPFDDVVEASRYVAALDHGFELLGSGLPISNRLIREVHGVLLAGGRGGDKRPGEFRTTQNWIGGSRPGNAHFVPPPPHRVPEAMGGLERFIHDEREPISTLIRAALVHVQFETIHPFLDGNGRVGRLLIALMLHDAGILRQPLLYLSLYFKEHRQEYYRLLDGVRRDGDWEAWVEFFLEGVAHTAGSAVSTAHRLLDLFEEDRSRIGKAPGVTGNTHRVFEGLHRRPVAMIPALAERAGVTYPTAAKAVGVLEALGIVQEVTGLPRGKIYVYRRFLDLLNEGTEVEGR